MLTNIGLAIIVLAWLYQLIKVAVGERGLQPLFVGLYALGVAVLVVDGLMAPAVAAPTIFNLISAAVAFGVLIVLIKNKSRIL